MYGGFHDKDKLILLSEKMQVCISQIKCNDCAVGVMHLLWWLAFAKTADIFILTVSTDARKYDTIATVLIFTKGEEFSCC